MAVKKITKENAAREKAVAYINSNSESTISEKAKAIFESNEDMSLTASMPLCINVKLRKDGDIVYKAKCCKCGRIFENDGKGTCSCGQEYDATHASEANLYGSYSLDKICFVVNYDEKTKSALVVVANATVGVNLDYALKVSEKNISAHVNDVFVVTEQGILPGGSVSRYSYYHSGQGWYASAIGNLIGFRKGNYVDAATSFISQLKSIDIVETSAMTEFLDGVGYTGTFLEFVEDKLYEKKTAVAKPSKTTKKVSPYDGKTLKEITIPEVVALGIHCPVARKTDVTTKGVTWHTSCICGHVEDIFVENNSEKHAEYPCGGSISEVSYYPYHSATEKETVSKLSKVFCEYNEGEDFYVFRKIEIKNTMDELLYTSMEITETMRVFLDATGIYCYSRENAFQDFEKTSVSDIDSMFSRYYSYNSSGSEDIILVKGKEYMEDTLKRSFLKYSGVREAWGLVDGVEGMGPAWSLNRNQYLYMWYQRPAMEQVMKVGLYNAARAMLSATIKDYPELVNAKGKGVYEILGINKPVLSIAKENNLSIKQIQQAQDMWNMDQTLDNETYSKLVSLLGNASGYYGRSDYNNGALVTAEEICQKFNIKFSAQAEYINEVYRYQCIAPLEALRHWLDYLNMAKKIGVKLRHDRKFPKSLRLEHDKCVFISNALSATEVDKKAFDEVAAKNDWLAWKYKKLVVINPHTPEEIVDEGIQLSHCVATYVERIKEQLTTVLFIRFAETPDEPYYTMEVKNGAVTEVKGYSNTAPTEPEVIELLNEYCKVKKLRKETTDF